MKNYIVWIAIALLVVACANAYVDIEQTNEISRLYKTIATVQESNAKRFKTIDLNQMRLLEALDYAVRSMK